MNLYHLKYFCDAVSNQSLVTSAQLNSVTPGAISQAIRKLEDFYQQSLIHHKKNTFQVTPIGKELYQCAIPLLSEFMSLKDKISQGESLEGELSFITQQSIAESLLAPFIKQFKKKYPAIILKMSLANTSLIKEKINSTNIDFAVTLNNVDLKDCSTKILKEGSFTLYQPVKSMQNKNLFLTTEETPEVIEFKKRYKKRFKVEPAIELEINSWGVLKKMAEQGNGTALIPDYLLFGKKNISSIETKMKLSMPSFQILSAHNSARSLSLKAETFLEELFLFLID